MNNHICEYCHRIDVEMHNDDYIKGMAWICCFKLIYEKGIIPLIPKKNTNEREGVPGINNN